MAEPALRLRVLTPRALVFDAPVRSLRVPTITGQVGLRPRSERALLGVEPGLILARDAGGWRFLASAGGLLRCDGPSALLLTPVAVSAESAEAVRTALDAALAGAGADLELRGLLQKLETGLMRELRNPALRAGT